MDASTQNPYLFEYNKKDREMQDKSNAEAIAIHRRIIAESEAIIKEAQSRIDTSKRVIQFLKGEVLELEAPVKKEDKPTEPQKTLNPPKKGELTGAVLDVLRHAPHDGMSVNEIVDALALLDGIDTKWVSVSRVVDKLVSRRKVYQTNPDQKRHKRFALIKGEGMRIVM